MTSPPRLIVVSYPAFLSLVCGTVYWSTTVQDDSDELIVVFIVSYFSTSGLDRSGHLPSKVWSEIMTNILQIDLPWITLRSKLVQEEKQGILYNTMFDEYARDNTKFQFNSGIMEDLYIWKDLLIRLFNLIDQDHSGFISLNEFSDVLKLLLYDGNDNDGINEANIAELSSAMDLDKNGRIDINEFLESFRIANVKKSGKLNDQTNQSGSSNKIVQNTNL
ncbi:unnamed protein product [Rotaria socialis]|uniref:EF-hand domain-containing protein n=5 Tax=Rotaria socialis TaxID=392032 RepID=A0A818NAX7_9BILA|nr:unnamed protein product [Rotaria socialis]